ncbi:MAG: hypothetical protein QM803_03775 [Rhodocyclaceae bacterium]|uniref:Flagellar protein FliT n=1 Tax=Sphingomonas sp. A1 TaxID=90322 RepID=A0A0F7QZI6_9SPHN|nr:hypothetical protein [Sphingomonas sp. A1]
MARSSLVLNLAYQLGQAAVERDWDGVARVDREIATALPRMAEKGAWTPGEAKALATLRETHRIVLEQCEREAADLDARMVSLRAHKDGWLAYAMEDENDMERHA